MNQYLTKEELDKITGNIFNSNFSLINPGQIINNSLSNYYKFKSYVITYTKEQINTKSNKFKLFLLLTQYFNNFNYYLLIEILNSFNDDVFSNLIKYLEVENFEDVYFRNDLYYINLTDEQKFINKYFKIVFGVDVTNNKYCVLFEDNLYFLNDISTIEEYCNEIYVDNIKKLYLLYKNIIKLRYNSKFYIFNKNNINRKEIMFIQNGNEK